MKNSKQLDWKVYESITKYIYETLGKEFNVQIDGFGHTCKVKGKSGVEHQIDVLTSEFRDNRNYRTAIECKYWNVKVSKDAIMKLIMTINDAKIDFGVIVSRYGFTKDALQFADFHNIKLVQLQEFNMEEKHSDTSEIILAYIDQIVSTNVRRPNITEIKILTKNGHEIDLTYANLYTTYFKSSGLKKKLIDYYLTFCDELHLTVPDTEISRSYFIKDASLYSKSFVINVCQINFRGLLTILNNEHNLTFSIVDKVWLIMQEIFEKRTFVISDKGYISEYPQKFEK